jgi:uncharacterized membrane protein YhaH (DUF805 family)
MTFSEAVRYCLNNYVTFSGRADRPQYWWFVLFNILVGIVAGIVDWILFGPDTRIIGALAGLALPLPTLAVAVRRLHDMDHTGWWILIGLTGIGAIILLVWFCFRGTEGPNRFGPPASGQNMSTARA